MPTKVAPVTKPKRFFVPQTDKKHFEQAYQLMIDFVQDQFRWELADRRIQRLEYIHDKKHYVAEVGQTEQLQGRYEIMAIFESAAFMIFTRTPKGGIGVTILVDKAEVETVVDFI